MTNTHTLAAESTMYLPRRNLANLLRRIAGRKLRVYPTHVVADAVVHSDHRPELTLALSPMGKPQAVFMWPGYIGGTTARLSVRERGADRPVRAEEVHRFPLRDAVQDALISQNDARRVLCGELDLGTAMAMAAARQLELEGLLDAPERSRDAADVDVALPPRVAAMFAEGVMPSPLPGSPEKPTESTTVLHDLLFIADALETAQFQVALTPGGADEGSVDNMAHVALCALHLVQAKLRVVADAAAVADVEAATAMDRLNESATDDKAKRAVNRVRSSLRFVTDRLPHVENPANA